MAVTFLKGGGTGGVQRRRILKRSISDENSKPGGIASAITYYITLAGLTDATLATFATIVVPNAIVQAGLGLTVTGGLGDGDSVEVSYWTIAISRVVGAAAQIAVSAISSTAIVAGVVGNAAVVISNVAVAGANTAAQQFALQVKVTRSAGVSANHSALIDMQMYNIQAGGAYVL